MASGKSINHFKTTYMGNSTAKDLRIILQTFILTALILGLILVGVNYLFDNYLKPNNAMRKSIAASLSLFITWMVGSAGVRNLNRLRETMGGLIFLIGGVVMAVGGLYVQEYAAKLKTLYP